MFTPHVMINSFSAHIALKRPRSRRSFKSARLVWKRVLYTVKLREVTEQCPKVPWFNNLKIENSCIFDLFGLYLNSTYCGQVPPFLRACHNWLSNSKLSRFPQVQSECQWTLVNGFSVIIIIIIIINFFTRVFSECTEAIATSLYH